MTFKYDIWKTGYEPSVFSVFQGGQGQYLKIKDYIVSSQLKDSNIGVMHYSPCAVFLNGEYWGFYWLVEKYNEDYLSYYYKVNPQNTIIIKAGDIESGDKDDWKYYLNMYEECSTLDLTKEENWNRVGNLIDIDSYVEYCAVMIFMSRIDDWSMSNFALWRTKYPEKNFYGDCKWRWMVFDFNSSGFFVDNNSIEYFQSQDKMFNNMLTNPKFYYMLKEKIRETGNSTFETNKMINLIDEYEVNFTDILNKNSQRFISDDVLPVKKSELLELKEFFQKRADIINSYLEK